MPLCPVTTVPCPNFAGTFDLIPQINTGKVCLGEILEDGNGKGVQMGLWGPGDDPSLHLGAGYLDFVA